MLKDHKMKNKIIFGLLAILMLGLSVYSAVAQPPVPAPVKITVKINGISAYYESLSVKNIATGEVLAKEQVPSLLLSNGVAIFDMSEFKQGYVAKTSRYSGDFIEIKACEVSTKCVVSYEIISTAPKEVNIIIEDSSIPIEKIIKEPVIIEKPVEKTEYVCSDGSKVESADKCAIETTEYEKYAVAALIGAGAVAGFIGLYKYYRKKKQLTRAEKMKDTYIKRRKK